MMMMMMMMMITPAAMEHSLLCFRNGMQVVIAVHQTERLSYLPVSYSLVRSV
jgi:hypothetical protein